MKVKPAGPDRAIPYPMSTELLPEDGADVPDTSYWRRRLRDGDVVPVDQSPPPQGTTLPARGRT
jgi:hypothetical protein